MAGVQKWVLLKNKVVISKVHGKTETVISNFRLRNFARRHIATRQL